MYSWTERQGYCVQLSEKVWLSQADKQGAGVYGEQLDQKAGLATLQRVDSVAEPLSDIHREEDIVT